MEAEVESTCGHQWRRSPSGTTAGTDYRNRFVGDEEDDRRGAWDNVGPQHLSVVVLCDIISEARIRDGKVKMPGMTHMHVLHMEGRGVLGMRQHLVPQSPTMRGLVGKLDALDPPGGSDSDAVLLMEVREGLKDAFRTLSVEAVRARVAALLEQLAGEVFRLGARASERGVWSYRLWDGKELEVMRSRNQGELEDWKELRDGVDMADVVRGIRSGREPVFIRPWKMRIRRMWDEIADWKAEYKREADNDDNDGRFTEEQLALLNDMMARHRDEARKRRSRGTGPVLPSLSWIEGGGGA